MLEISKGISKRNGMGGAKRVEVRGVGNFFLSPPPFPVYTTPPLAFSGW